MVIAKVISELLKLFLEFRLFHEYNKHNKLTLVNLAVVGLRCGLYLDN